MNDLEAVAHQLGKASAPEDVFGSLDGASLDERMHALIACYRRTVLSIHPDKFDGRPEAATARDLFVRLTEWRAMAERKIQTGTYGDGKALDQPAAEAAYPQVIKTPRREYVVTGLLAHGDLADVYVSTYRQDGKENSVVLKVAQSAADNDLLENEATTLREMYADGQPEEKFYRYLPKPVDTFVLRGSSGSHRRANVMQLADGYVSLAEVIRAYPRGLDYRDVVWMFKRALAAIGYVHIHKHVVHGALIPPHIMVHPTGHGAKIVDWCYSVRDWEKRAGRVRALSGPWREFYAPEILARQPPTPHTDLYMLAKCCVRLLGGNVATGQMPASVPTQVQAFLGSCLLGAQTRRPDDAWDLHQEFDQLLERLVGKPTYRPLVMPAP